MAEQEFLASFGVEIDEAGVTRLQKVLEENRELADRLAAAFDAASASLRAFAEDLGVLPDFSGRPLSFFQNKKGQDILSCPLYLVCINS